MTKQDIKKFFETDRGIYLANQEISAIKELLTKERQIIDYRIWEFRETQSRKYLNGYPAITGLMKALMGSAISDQLFRPKVVYIAHAIRGDVSSNLVDIRRIVRVINMDHHGIIPFVPYYADCVSLDDEVEEERNRGIANDTYILKRGFIDELWLTGKTISTGMTAERKLAEELNIPVIDKIGLL